MAAAVRISAVGGSSSGTGDRNATITPASGDLLVVYCCVAANTNNAPTCSDNNGGGTYDLIEILNFTIAAVEYRMSVFIRTALMANTTSTVVTVATGSNSSGAVHVLALTGITRTGANAVRSEGSQNNQAAATAAPTLNQAALTNNPTLVAIGSADTTTTAPTNWTEIQDTNFANDTVALETAFRASGFTGTTITFGAAQSTQFCAHAMELDTTVLLTQSAADDVNNLADARGLGYGNLHTDSVANLADAATIVIGHVFSFGDNANNLADGSVRVIGILNPTQDSLQALTDVLAQLLSYQLLFADSEAANWADSHNLLLSQFLALADSNSLSDAATINLGYRAQPTDALNSLTDTLEQHLGTVQEFADDLNTFDDSFASLLTYELDLSDSSLTFPSTPILDDFNRSDEGPPPSTNWTTGIAGGFDGFAEPGFDVVSNQLRNLGNDVAQQYWNAEQFGPDSEAYITLANSSDLRSLALSARLTDIGEFTTEGYAAHVFFSDQDGGKNNYFIYKITNGSLTIIGSSNELVPSTPVSGHSYGIRTLGDKIQCWADTGSGWELKLSATDSSYSTAGFIGLNTESNINSRQDNFGGGTVKGGLQDGFAKQLATGPALAFDFSDSFTLTDSLALGHGMDFANSLSLVDSVEMRLSEIVSLTDAFAITDSEAHVLGQYLTSADSIDFLVDAHALQLGQLASHNDTLPGFDDTCALELAHRLSFTDTITLTDTYAQNLASTILERTLELADDLNLLSDSLTLTLGLTFTDTLANLADVETHTLGHSLTLAESIANLSDSVSLQLQYLTDFNDSLTLTDSESAILGQRLSFADSIDNLTDAATLLMGQRVAFADSLATFADAYAQQLGELLTFNDSLALTDSIQLGYGLVLNDNIDLLIDSIATSAPQGPLRQVGVTDSVDILADSIALRLDYLLAVTDATSLDDSLALNEGLFIAFTDVLSLTDTTTSTLGHLVPLADTLAFNDSVQLRLGYELVLADVITLTDNTTLNLSYSLTLTDNASLLADSVAKSVGLGVIITDNAPTLTDAISLFSAWLLQLSDALALTDSLTKSGAGFLPLADSLTLADSVAIELRGPDLNASLTDSLTLTDAIALDLGNELQLQLVISDVITLTDHYFDLRHPYTPSTKRHIVVPSRARTTTPTRRREVIVPASSRTTRVE